MKNLRFISAIFSLLFVASIAPQNAQAVSRSGQRPFQNSNQAQLPFSNEGKAVRETLRKHLRIGGTEWAETVVDVQWTPFKGIYKSSVRFAGLSRGPASEVFYLICKNGKVADLRPDEDLGKFLLSWNKITEDNRPKIKSQGELAKYLEELFEVYTLSPTSFACQDFGGRTSVICKLQINYVGSKTEESIRVSSNGSVFVLR